MKPAIVLLVALFVASSVTADIPESIPHQGRVISNGQNFDGVGQFKFLLFGDEDADHNSGNELAIWSNTTTTPANMNEPSAAVSLFVTKGLYSVWLGDTDTSGMAALPVDFDPSDKQLYLRLWFDDGSNGMQQLVPDQKIASVPYALLTAKAEFATNAGTAQSVPAGSIGSVQIANGAIQEIDMANESITQDKLAPGAATTLAVSGDAADHRVAVQGDGTVVMGDQSTSVAPAPVFEFLDSDGTNLSIPTGVEVQGNFVYCIDPNTDILQVFDVTDPGNIVPRGSIASTTNSNYKALAVEGDFAYVVDANDDLLRVFNIANPDSLLALGTISTSSDPVDVEVKDKIAFVIDEAEGVLQIFDATNPNSITARGSTTASMSTPVDMALQGGFAYVVDDGADRLQVFDVSDIDNIAAMDFDGTNMSRARAIAVSGDHAFVAFGGTLAQSGIQIFDVSNAASITALDAASIASGLVFDVAVRDGYAFISHITEGLLSFNVSDVNNVIPWIPGGVFSGQIRELASEGGYLYAGDSSSGNLKVYQLSPAVSVAGTLSVAGEAAFESVSLAGPLIFSDGTQLTTASIPQTLSLSGNTLSISDGNNVNLASIDNQTLSLAGDTLIISGGNTVNLDQYLLGDGSEAVTGNLTVNGDVTADSFKFPSAQTFTHQVSASSFVPDSPSEGYNRGSGLISPSGGDTTLFFHASVHLPEGATITKVTGVFFDNSNSERFIDILLRLRYVTNTNLGSVTMAEVTGASSAVFASGRFELDDTTISQAGIDNDNRMYSMDFQATVSSATQATRFYGVRIEYTLDTLLP